MINKESIKAIHAINSVEDLKNLPAVPAETFFGELHLDGNGIYEEEGADHRVILYQHELPFYPHVTLKYKDLLYLDEDYCAQEDTLIFDFKNLRVLHDCSLTFLESDLDDPDGEDLEFWHQESFEKDFNNIESLMAYLKGFFGENGFNKHLLQPDNLKNIFRKAENKFYEKRYNKAA